MTTTRYLNVFSAEAIFFATVLLACISLFAMNFDLSFKAMASAVAFFFMHHTVALHLHHHLHHTHAMVFWPTVFARKHPGWLQYPFLIECVL
jgi:hypothetical protein